MSAYCIFVKKLADKCGMEYDCGDGLLAFFGMYVFEYKDKPFLTTKEAAAFTGIGEHTLRRLAKDVGYEICFYVGDKLMFKRNSLIAYLEKCEEL